jgi:hypothetical protein
MTFYWHADREINGFGFKPIPVTVEIEFDQYGGSIYMLNKEFEDDSAIYNTIEWILSNDWNILNDEEREFLNQLKFYMVRG